MSSPLDAMTGLKLHLEGDGCWPDLDFSEGKDIDGGSIDEIAVLERGMVSGAPSVGVLIGLPDGRRVIAQTSLKLLLSAADAFRTKCGDPRQEQGHG